MILHTRPAHRGGLMAKCALLLLALVVLPLSAKAQREPAAAEAAPTFVPANGTPQNVLPGTTAAPTTDPAAGAPATQAILELVGQSAANPAAGGPATPAAPGGRGIGPAVPAAANPFAPPGGIASAASSATEDRLSRLEKMVQSILTEMHGQHRNVRWVVGNQSGSSNGMGSGTASVSLSDLKKERIDLEDDMESLKDRLDKIDAQIAKLQSARSSNHPVNESLQTK